MDNDSAWRSDPGPRHRSMPEVRVDPDYRAGRPVPSVRVNQAQGKGHRTPASRESSPKSVNLVASFPLFFFGAGCIAVAAFIVLDGSGAALGRIPLWLPFLALSAIALGGGALSIFAEPDEPPGEETVEPDTGDVGPPVPRARSRSQSVAVPPETVPPSPLAPRAISPLGASPLARETRSVSVATRASVSEVPSDEPPLTSLGSEAEELLHELDLIEADLRTSLVANRPRLSSRSPSPADSSPSVVTAPSPDPAGKPRAEPLQPSNVARVRPEPETIRQVAHCVGCGSVILHTSPPSKCRLCGQPLCPDCRERSLAEGNPNLCPLCSLLDEVHSRGSASASATRP
jgi:hypothetical protein